MFSAQLTYGLLYAQDCTKGGDGRCQRLATQPDME